MHLTKQITYTHVTKFEISFGLGKFSEYSATFRTTSCDAIVSRLI